MHRIIVLAPAEFIGGIDPAGSSGACGICRRLLFMETLVAVSTTTCAKFRPCSSVARREFLVLSAGADRRSLGLLCGANLAAVGFLGARSGLSDPCAADVGAVRFTVFSHGSLQLFDLTA